MIKISLPVKLAIQKAKNHGCKTVGDAVKFITSDPGYENWVAQDVMDTVQQVYGSSCPLDKVAGITAFSDVEMQGKGDEEGGEGDGEGEGKPGEHGKCGKCGKPKKGSKPKDGDKPGDGTPKKKKGDKPGDKEGDGDEETGDGSSDGDGDPERDRENEGDSDGDDAPDGEGGDGAETPGEGEGEDEGEGECQGHEGDEDGDGDGKDGKDGKGDGKPKDRPGKPGGSRTENWKFPFRKQWFTKDVLDSPFIDKDFDGIAKEARKWNPNKTVGDRVNACLSQIADLGGDSDDEPDRYHVGKLVTRIATRQGGLQSHCRRNERGRRKVLLLPDVSGSCVAFSASALEFCYSAAMVDERIVVIETFDGQIRMPGECWSGDGGREALEKRRSAPFPFTEKQYKEKFKVMDEGTSIEREKNFIDWIMNGDFCAVIALGDTQGGWLYRALDQKGMKVFWMDPGDYTFVARHAIANNVARQKKALSLGRYAPLPHDADARKDGDHPRDMGYGYGWYGFRASDTSDLKRYRNVSYSVNMSHDVEGFIESLELIIKEY